MSVQQTSTDTNPPLNREDRFLHLKSIDVSFREPPQSKAEIKLSDASLKRKSPELQAGYILHWDCDIYVKASTSPLLTVRRLRIARRSSAVLVECSLDFKLLESADSKSFEQKDEASGVTVTIILGNARSAAEVTRLLANDATMAFGTKVKTLEKFDRVKTYLDFAVETGKAAAELYPPLKVIAAVVSKAFERLQKITECHHELALIMDDVASVLPSIEMAFNQVKTEEVRIAIYQYLDIVRSLSDSIIRAYSSSTPAFWFRNYHKPGLNDFDDKKRRMENLKGRLQIALAVDTRNEVSDIRQHQLSEEDERNLERLKPPKFSSFDRSRCCLAGTRKSVIQDVVSWAVSTNNSSRIFWLHGVAGCGKSSIASSVSSTLGKQSTPSYSFFCKRDDPERRSAVRVIQALAYYLAKTIGPYRAILAQELRKDLTILDRPLLNQFEALFPDSKGEILSSARLIPIVIVLDALDECNENETISALLPKLLSFAPCIKLIVTSRPLLGIERELQSSQTLVRPYDLFTVSAEGDILAYAKYRFETDKNLVDLRGYVTHVEVEELARRALGLFIWIAVVCSYISDRKSGRLKLVKVILQSAGALGPESRLDELYAQVLKHAAGSEDISGNRDDVRLIVGLIYATSKNRPLPAAALFAFGSAQFSGSEKEWDDILLDLRSVLPLDTKTNATRVCHKSFLDFLGDKSRSGEFWMDPEELDGMMADKCLQIMLSGLQFNICDLKSSYCPTSDAKDLRIDEHISRELQYSCLYWLGHLLRCKDGLVPQEALRLKLRELLCRETSLYWLEVMSLLSELREAVIILKTLSGILKVLSDEDKLYAFTVELSYFVESFYEPMATSAPHIYISALIWTPSESFIAKSIGSAFNSQTSILDGRDRLWSTNTQTLLQDSGVKCVAYSPNGRFIVSGCDDYTIRILDAHTGAPVGKPLRGHEDTVWSVNYSPDGRRIVSGSADKTIRIWDAEIYIPIGEPLQGHEGTVWSVDFSPDGRQIVSGSQDKTIRMWDATTYAPVGEPIRGHEETIESVNYSPNGRHIVSGSGDRTIRIWDAETAAPVGEPLRGHGGSVWSVAYSPDGRRIVSGSDDKTIRIWDAATRESIGEPLRGHEESVESVKYSPDGCRIVSGSGDSTIRIWDAQTGAPVGKPLRGHVNFVRSVKYSPDGRRIVSGSDDETVRIWDAETGALVGELPRGHEYSVESVNYSPDGGRIVSGTEGITIRIWDAHTGAPVGSPLRGHEGSVWSVTYSPDGRRIVSGSQDKTIRIWDPETGVPVCKPLRGHEYSVFSVSYSPDGCRIASGSRDGTIRIWDAVTGALVGEPLRGHEGSVFSVTYSPDGRRIVSESEDKTIRIWDAVTGAPVGKPLRGHEGWVRSVNYSPDGRRIVSGSDDNTIRIWDAETGAPVGEPLRGHESSVLSVNYSPDGRRIVSGSEGNTIWIWDAVTGAPVGEPLRGHEHSVLSVNYSPDGRRIVSGSDDNTIRIWDAVTGAPIGEPLRGHELSVYSVKYSPDGRRIVSGSGDTTIRIWEAETDTSYVPSSQPVGEWRYSLDEECFVPVESAAEMPDAGATARSCSPQFVPPDGWIRTVDDGLLLWIPPRHRRNVCDMSLMCISRDPDERPVHVDWRKLSYGTAWFNV